jgi:type IV secretory pathway component VirB8
MGDSPAMIESLEKARRYLWAFVELGFVALLAIILIYLLLGQNSGEYVVSVADNVKNFASEASASLIGIGIILALIYLVMQRMK